MRPVITFSQIAEATLFNEQKGINQLWNYR